MTVKFLFLKNELSTDVNKLIFSCFVLIWGMLPILNQVNGPNVRKSLWRKEQNCNTLKASLAFPNKILLIWVILGMYLAYVRSRRIVIESMWSPIILCNFT